MNCLRSLRQLVLIAPLAAVVSACSSTDGTSPAGPDGSGAATDASADALEAGSSAPPGNVPPAGVVVVQSDFKATSVSLIDPATGALTRDNCINSGSQAPQLTAALSGDVVVPTQPQPGNELVLIDRTNNVLTWLDPKTCVVARQLNVGEGKPTNPQDVIAVSAHKAYVPRYAASAGDLLIIDPQDAKIVGHLDLRAQAPTGEGGKAVQPNPSRGVFARGQVYVVLDNLSDDLKSGAAGRVVIIDPTKDLVVGVVDLPTLKNCASAAYVESAGALVVGCGGVYEDPKQVDDSGVAWIDLTMSPPAVRIARAKETGRAFSPFDATALTASLGFAITSGSFGGTPDQLWALDFAGAAPRKILDGSGAFTFSGLLVDEARKKLFIADAAMATPKLHIFDLTNAAAPALQTSLTTTATGLPPRYVSWY